MGAVPANVTLLTPSVGLIGRSLQVQISTVSTQFSTNAPSVDFGDPGITVTKTNVDSDDNLLASVNIAPTAKFGAHTVTVTTGGQTLKVVGGFTVNPELVAEPMMTAPTVPQGGLVIYDFRNEDYVNNPLTNVYGAQTLSGNSLYTPTLYSGTLNFPGSGAARYADFKLVDPLATPGPAVATVQGHDPFGNPISYYVDPADPSLAQITTRTPTAVTSGTPVPAQSFPAPNATNLYAINNPAANSVLLGLYSNLGTCFSSGPFGQITGQTAPMGGQFKNGQPLSTVAYTKAGAAAQATLALLGMTGTNYVSTYRIDGGGAATGCNYDVNFLTLPTVAFSAKEPVPPDTPAKPLAILNLSTTSALMATDGAVDSNPDYDYFQYNLTAPGDVYILVIPKTSIPFAGFANYQVYSDSKCSVPVATTQGYTNIIHDTVPAGGLSRCFSIEGFNPSDTYTIIFVAQ